MREVGYGVEKRNASKAPNMGNYSIGSYLITLNR